LIDPCIKGTQNVLNSCIKAKVKRVVLTSSCSSIRYRDDVQQISPLNESHWSDSEYCKRYNVTTLPSHILVWITNLCGIFYTLEKKEKNI
jgi:nucleoside-diphosphate-sugar epimerase